MPDRHTDKIMKKKHPIDLSGDKLQPVHNTPTVWLISEQLAATDINRTFCEKVIERVTTDCTHPTVCTLLKDGSFRFCVIYQKLKFLSLKYLYVLPRMAQCINSMAWQHYFQH